jgi:hypothetical protein
LLRAKKARMGYNFAGVEDQSDPAIAENRTA